MSANPETPKERCLCADCRRPMRPRGVLLKQMPGTMAWGHSGKCKSCVQPFVLKDQDKRIKDPKSVPRRDDGSRDLHLEETVIGLNAFVAAREQRRRVQASKLNAFKVTGGHRLPAPAPKAVPARLQRKTA